MIHARYQTDELQKFKFSIDIANNLIKIHDYVVDPLEKPKIFSLLKNEFMSIF